MQKETLRKHNLSAVPTPEGQVSRPEEPGFLPSEADDTCPKCFGLGIEVIPDKGARPCDCRRRETQNQFFERARLPKRYERCHFSNYQVNRDVSQKRALGLASKFANEYPAVDQGILFIGPVGVGKTHLAVSILKGLMERGIPCLFYEFGSLLKEIQSSYDSSTQTSEWRVLAPVFQADVLVLDELGSSKPTQWVQDTMYHIINTRYNDRKITLFTTNYLDERRNDREETLDDRIGARLRSRLHEMCRTVQINGEDFRRTLNRAAR